ncbi:hypothetical protein PRK78_002462 [Emydomyces testavorans]|uniref:Uncharacterized protein n=1 Tax=Emydomyces testavorans TaxID=2070801 RepID=A0AAF0DF16_9EURO|nr:hypothetical protein PRK78_002462 [Emydomyces testavorans]
MKLPSLLVATTLAISPLASAWRVYFYNWENENPDGGYITEGGPGNPGSRCFSNVDPLNNKISSLRYYSDNPEGTTRCCLHLYDSPGCDNEFKVGPICRDQFVNLHNIGIDNDISSYKTECYRI